MKNKNTIKCLACGKELTSKHRHDFVGCGCPNQTHVDGGTDYRKCGGVDLGKIAAWDPTTKTFKPLS